MSEQVLTDSHSIGAQFGNCMADIDRVPKDDGRDSEIETRSPVALILEGAGADFAAAVKEHQPGERVARLALVEAGRSSAVAVRVSDPVEGEDGAFEPSYLPKRLREGILFGVSGEPASGSTAQRFQP
jgi:hypothetical protein